MPVPNFVEALAYDFADGLLDDEGGEVTRRIVDAEAFSLCGLWHLGLVGGLSVPVGEQPADAEFLQFGDGLLEEVSEYVNIHFVAEIVPADALEEIRPLIVELEFVHLGIVAEQAAVVTPVERETFVSLVDGSE